MPKLVAFRPDQPPRRLIERFPGAGPEIEALWRRDGEFREICRDYREARRPSVLDQLTRAIESRPKDGQLRLLYALMNTSAADRTLQELIAFNPAALTARARPAGLPTRYG